MGGRRHPFAFNRWRDPRVQPGSGAAFRREPRERPRKDLPDSLRSRGRALLPQGKRQESPLRHPHPKPRGVGHRCLRPSSILVLERGSDTRFRGSADGLRRLRAGRDAAEGAGRERPQHRQRRLRFLGRAVLSPSRLTPRRDPGSGLRQYRRAGARERKTPGSLPSPASPRGSSRGIPSTISPVPPAKTS